MGVAVGALRIDGNDTLTGGAGSDTILGGIGNDLIFAVDGEVDFLYGGAGTDTAFADKDDEVPLEDIEDLIT